MKARAKEVTTLDMSTPAEDTVTVATTADTSSTVSEDEKTILLDRDTYRKIKKMDRASLGSLIQDIYESGRKKGRSEVNADDDSADARDEIAIPPSDDHNSLDLCKLEQQLKAVKGVGEKRAEEIMGIIETWLGVE